MYNLESDQMTDITDLSKHVIDTIKSTDEYKAYAAGLSEIKADPQLYHRVSEMRERNYTLHQSDIDPGELMDLMDALTNDYEDVINNESVARFLEAEAAICRLVQEFNSMVTEGLEFD